LSELSGAVNRLDLCVKSSDEEWVVIELKYCAVKGKLKPEAIDDALSSVATSKLVLPVTDESLAEAVRSKLPRKEIRRILAKSGKANATLAEVNAVLAERSIDLLTDAEYDRVLAGSARKNLSDDEIAKALAEKGHAKDFIDAILSRDVSSDETIERILSKAVDQALKDIETRDYRSLIKPFAGKITAMGMAVFEYGSKVKAAFAPDGRSPRTEPKRSAKNG
jgi:hypothetical protein